MQLKLIIRQLQQEGIHKIDGVCNGEQARSHIAKYPPDLVISAMYLPDMTADELIKQIQEEQGSHDMAFMLISSETDPKALEPVRQAGVVAILPKPFNLTDLRRAIRATLDIIDPHEIELQHYDVSALKVLLVDDSVTARNHLSRVLTSMGIHQIDLAENGRQALSLLKDRLYDLMVTDLNMPEMDGQALIHYIRHKMGDVVLPILMVTTDHDQTRLENIQQAGVSAILDKPFEPRTVREMLFRILDS